MKIRLLNKICKQLFENKFSSSSSYLDKILLFVNNLGLKLSITLLWTSISYLYVQVQENNYFVKQYYIVNNISSFYKYIKNYI